MRRKLTDCERHVLVAMIERADDPDAPVTVEQRRRWLDQVAGISAGAMCECGTCPSIELVDSDTTPSPTQRDESGLTLSASTPEAMLMLFIGGDRPSYLELAPIEDHCSITQFPPVEQIDFS